MNNRCTVSLKDRLAQGPVSIEDFQGPDREFALDRQRMFPLLLSPGVPHFENIRPCPHLATDHFLSAFIQKPGALSRIHLEQIVQDPRINLSITALGPGTIPASSNRATDYSTHSWTRDTALVACGLKWTGHNDMAVRVVENLAFFYNQSPQRDRIVSFHFDSDPYARYRSGKNLPIIRAPIDEHGALTFTPKADEWGHAQLDAIGMWLWTTFRFANQGLLDLPQLDQRLTAAHKWNGLESIFIAATKFLGRIQYHEQYDLSLWEERNAYKRATSVGFCKAALCEMREYFNKAGWEILTPKGQGNAAAYGVWLHKLIDELIENGRQSLASRIPDSPENQGAIETDTPGVPAADAGLAMLLYPFEVGLSHNQQISILRTVYGLMGEVGFKRYHGDAFWNWNKHEAEWCLFDPVLAAYYFRRYMDSGGREFDSYRYGHQHLKRALSHITSRADSYVLGNGSERVHIAAGLCPEAYVYDAHRAGSHARPWRANPNSPLNLTVASLALALERGRLATEFHEKYEGDFQKLIALAQDEYGARIVELPHRRKSA